MFCTDRETFVYAVAHNFQFALVCVTLAAFLALVAVAFLGRRP